MYSNRLITPRYTYTDYAKLSYYALVPTPFGQWTGLVLYIFYSFLIKIINFFL
jgi:hypothetical protein